MGPHRGQVSRRSFLRGSAIGAAGSAVVDTVVPEFLNQAHAADNDIAGPGPVPIVLNVNNISHALSVTPATTLVDALRDVLELTGTKLSCNRGACSACTVWLDGAPVASCLMLAIDVGARKITTIEGLARGDELHPVQSAFIAHDALQCGFCTPGMVMSCAALLEKNPHPSADDVRSAVSGHLCRCGTYPHVIAATLDAANGKT